MTVLTIKPQKKLMKKVSRNKFLLCFKPEVLEVEDNLESDGEKKGDMKISEESTSILLLDKDCSKVSGEISRNSTSKRTFSKVVKAVLFQISLSKKVHDRKVSRESFRSKSCRNLLTKTDSLFDLKGEKLVKMKSFDSNTRVEIAKPKSNSLLASSTSLPPLPLPSPSPSPSSRTIRESNAPNSKQDTTSQMKKKKKKKKKRAFMGCCSSLNAGVLLLLFSLTLTILWGRICAVLVTSIWLYFFPRRRNLEEQRSENVVELPEMESRDYKKRVIMEGLLERNHHHHTKGH